MTEQGGGYLRDTHFQNTNPTGKIKISVAASLGMICGIAGFSLACTRIALGSGTDGCYLSFTPYSLVLFVLGIIVLILGIIRFVRTRRLAVLAISIILTGFIALSALNKMLLGYPKTKVANLQIKEFEWAIEAFQIDTSRLPTTSEGLDALVRNPENLIGWNGPYLRKEIPLDPWQRPFHYRNPGLHDPDTYDLWSDGIDGIEGTKDDITNFK
jgi:general secretion pathway protein G